ncbi:hypothetical protein AHF37_08228 [Paragonimus kellicotti]|nr:hypothetical protein AHF37_08228 [Paragonimus kellicotti]
MKLGPHLTESIQKRAAIVTSESRQLRTSTPAVPETATPTLNEAKLKCVDCSQGAAGIVSRKWLEQLIAKLQHLLVTDDFPCPMHCVHEPRMWALIVNHFIALVYTARKVKQRVKITPSVRCRRHDFPVFVPVDECLPKRKLMSPSRITPEYRIGTSVPQALRSGYSEKKRRPRSQSVGRIGSARLSKSGRNSTQMTTAAHRVPSTRPSPAFSPRILLTDSNGLLKDLSTKNSSPRIHPVKVDGCRLIPRCAWK